MGCVTDLSFCTVLFLALSFFDTTIPIAAGPSNISSVEAIPESPVDDTPVSFWYCGVAKDPVVAALAVCSTTLTGCGAMLAVCSTTLAGCGAVLAGCGTGALTTTS